MKLQNLTVIFIIIILPVILIVSLYISTGLKTIKNQSIYDTGLVTATHDAIYAFELNTTNDAYSNNAETKRNILKSSIKLFEKSLCSVCGIYAYNTDEIEQYIPAMVFGMYDGFYMYAPSLVPNSNPPQYQHSLQSYVYYSEIIEGETVIRYSLDNYVSISGSFNGKYETREGHLIVLSGSNASGTRYMNVPITSEGVEYYKEAYDFTSKLLSEADWPIPDYLKPSNSNNPEDENSAFAQNKRKVMKEKIENVLNSSITAYSRRIGGYNYKMPNLSEEDWQKIYSDISMITFFQGKSIGLIDYNGYCVLNSTNHNEYVNPNLIYFIDADNTYHDIRCNALSGTMVGHTIGSFRKRKVDVVNDDDTVSQAYVYDYDALACYDCINGSLATSTSVSDYIKSASTSKKTAYYTALGKERYRIMKLMNQ